MYANLSTKHYEEVVEEWIKTMTAVSRLEPTPFIDPDAKIIPLMLGGIGTGMFAK